MNKYEFLKFQLIPRCVNCDIILFCKYRKRCKCCDDLLCISCAFRRICNTCFIKNIQYVCEICKLHYCSRCIIRCTCSQLICYGCLTGVETLFTKYYKSLHIEHYINNRVTSQFKIGYMLYKYKFSKALIYEINHSMRIRVIQFIL